MTIFQLTPVNISQDRHKLIKILCKPVEKLSHHKNLFRHNISKSSKIRLQCNFLHVDNRNWYKELLGNFPFSFQKYNRNDLLRSKIRCAVIIYDISYIIHLIYFRDINQA